MKKKSINAEEFDTLFPSRVTRHLSRFLRHW